METPNDNQRTDADAPVPPAAAGSTAPDADADRRRYGLTFAEYSEAYRRYIEAYGNDTVRYDDRVARDWWWIGTEPFEAAKHIASGTKPWATAP